MIYQDIVYFETTKTTNNIDGERMSVQRNLTMSKTENALVAASFYAFFKKLLRDSEVSLLIARSFFSPSAPYHLC